MTDEINSKRLRIPTTWLRWGSVIALVAAIGIGGTVFVAKNKPEILGLSNPVAGSQQEIDMLIADIKKLIVLPDEQPTVATVSDINKLRDQPFFASAQNGDKVLIFTNAKKAILYRPGSRLIIDVAPVTIGAEATQSGQAAGAQTETRVTVVLRNGTAIDGLTKKYESEFKEKAPDLTIVGRENAKRSDYDKSVLVDVKGTRSVLTSQLARALDITIDTLPKGEATPAADFLIVLGSDKQ